MAGFREVKMEGPGHVPGRDYMKDLKNYPADRNWNEDQKAGILEEQLRLNDERMANQALAKQEGNANEALVPAGQNALEKSQAKEPGKDRRFEVTFADARESIAQRAREIAEEKLRAEREGLKSQSWYKRIPKAMWFDIAYEARRQIEKERAQKSIEADKNLYIDQNAANGAIDTAAEMVALVDRLTLEDNAGLETAEQKQVFEASVNDLATKKKLADLQDSLRNIVRRYATGEIADKAMFDAERQRVFQDLGLGKDSPVQVYGLAVGDNMWNVAEQVKAAVSTGERAETLAAGIEFNLVKARLGARTEQEYNTVDRVLEKMKLLKVKPAIANELTLAVAVGTALSVGPLALKRILSSRAAAIGTLGASSAVAGGFAAMRENKRLGEERKKHLRDRAYGQEFGKDAKARAELEVFADVRSAKAMQAEIERVLAKPELTDHDRSSLVDTLAELEARRNLSGTRKIDFLAYEEQKSVEAQRLEIAELRVKARKYIKDNYAGFEKLGRVAEKDPDSFLAAQVRVFENQLTDTANSQDQAFWRFRARKSLKAGAKTAATALLAGAITQEIAAEIGSAAGLSKTRGLFSRLFGAKPQVGERNTILASVYEYFQGKPEAGVKMAAAGEALNHTEAVAATPGSVSQQECTVSADTFNTQHQAELNDVKHRVWMGYDTPNPQVEKNELGLDFVAGKDGSKSLSMGRMFGRESFGGGFNESVMAEHHTAYKFAVFPTGSEKAFLVDVDEHGHAVLPENSTVSKLFHVVNGKMVFDGSKVEVLHNNGSGSFDVLATAIGKKVNEFKDVITVRSPGGIPVAGNAPGQVVSQAAAEVPTQPWFGAAINSRRPLEGATTKPGNQALEPQIPVLEGEPVFDDINQPEQNLLAGKDRKQLNEARDLAGVLVARRPKPPELSSGAQAALENQTSPGQLKPADMSAGSLENSVNQEQFEGVKSAEVQRNLGTQKIAAGVTTQLESARKTEIMPENADLTLAELMNQGGVSFAEGLKGQFLSEQEFKGINNFLDKYIFARNPDIGNFFDSVGDNLHTVFDELPDISGAPLCSYDARTKTITFRILQSGPNGLNFALPESRDNEFVESVRAAISSNQPNALPGIGVEPVVAEQRPVVESAPAAEVVDLVPPVESQNAIAEKEPKISKLIFNDLEKSINEKGKIIDRRHDLTNKLLKEYGIEGGLNLDYNMVRSAFQKWEGGLSDKEKVLSSAELSKKFADEVYDRIQKRFFNQLDKSSPSEKELVAKKKIVFILGRTNPDFENEWFKGMGINDNDRSKYFFFSLGRNPASNAGQLESDSFNTLVRLARKTVEANSLSQDNGPMNTVQPAEIPQAEQQPETSPEEPAEATRVNPASEVLSEVESSDEQERQAELVLERYSEIKKYLEDKELASQTLQTLRSLDSGKGKLKDFINAFNSDEKDKFIFRKQILRILAEEQNPGKSLVEYVGEDNLADVERDLKQITDFMEEFVTYGNGRMKPEQKKALVGKLVGRVSS